MFGLKVVGMPTNVALKVGSALAYKTKITNNENDKVILKKGTYRL